MCDREFMSEMVEKIDELKRRVVDQTENVERTFGDEMYEQKATLRNVVMQLEGLKLMLLKTQRH